MSALKYLRSRASGIGIPDDPTYADISRVLEYLSINTRIRWATGQTLTPLASEQIGWADGFNGGKDVYAYDRPRHSS